jgi:hypothetical protein
MMITWSHERRAPFADVIVGSAYASDTIGVVWCTLCVRWYVLEITAQFRCNPALSSHPNLHAATDSSSSSFAEEETNRPAVACRRRSIAQLITQMRLHSQMKAPPAPWRSQEIKVQAESWQLKDWCYYDYYDYKCRPMEPNYNTQ